MHATEVFRKSTKVLLWMKKNCNFSSFALFH